MINAASEEDSTDSLRRVCHIEATQAGESSRPLACRSLHVVCTHFGGEKIRGPSERDSIKSQKNKIKFNSLKEPHLLFYRFSSLNI